VETKKEGKNKQLKDLVMLKQVRLLRGKRKEERKEINQRKKKKKILIVMTL
jgi:hypothetical protein